MMFLSALCVLLPLAAALNTCDNNKSKAFLAKTQLEGSPLKTFNNKKFWFVASGKKGSNSEVASGEITFGQVEDNSVSVDFINRDSSGDTVESSSTTYTLDGNHVLAQDGDVALYFFKCSKHLIAAYRCQTEGNSGSSGPGYYIWAAWDKSDSDVSGEVKSCEAEIKKVDSSASFVSRVHP